MPAGRADDEGEHRLGQRDPEMVARCRRRSSCVQVRAEHVERRREEELRSSSTSPEHRIDGERRARSASEHDHDQELQREELGAVHAAAPSTSSAHRPSHRPSAPRPAGDAQISLWMSWKAGSSRISAMSRGRGSVTREVADDAGGRPGRHHHHPVGQRDRLLEVVGDEHHRLAVLRPEVEQQVAHDLPGLRVERPERLVHQQDLGVADQHLRQRDALALPARQHVRVAIDEGAQADAGEPVARRGGRPRRRGRPSAPAPPRRCRAPSSTASARPAWKR